MPKAVKPTKTSTAAPVTKAATTTVKCAFDLEVPNEGWIDYLTQYHDIFGVTYYAGYWLRSVEWNTMRGHLCFEYEDKYEDGKEPNRAKAIKVWKTSPNALLPRGWHRLDAAMAIKAYVEAVKMWGVDWMAGDHNDGAGYEFAVQMAMLGEVKYG